MNQIFRAGLMLVVLSLSATSAEPISAKILEGAKKQAAERTIYTPGYARIVYPNGDVPRATGVCTDVLVRALRNAEIDLQKLIHEDMRENFSVYPQKWALKKPDSNIDHRRVPNHICYFTRKGMKLTTHLSAESLNHWQPGDLVYWKLDNGLDHCGVISDARNPSGIPLVIHNISQCCEEDCLTRWKIIAHFRCRP